MADVIVWGSAILVAGVLLFGLSFWVGILLGRRIDRGLQTRLASAEAMAAATAEAADAEKTTGATTAVIDRSDEEGEEGPTDTADPTEPADPTQEETGHG
jgi:hypothetical protein